MPTPSTTSTFSFSLWPEQPRPDPIAPAQQLNPESDPKRVSGRELAERMRAKRRASDQWETENVRTVRLRPPTRQQPVSGNGQAKQAPSTAAVSPTAPFDLDPYGWAFLFWVTGLVVWFRHPQFFTHWVVFAAVVLLVAPAQYLIRTALLIGAGWFLLHKYQIL